MGALGCWIKRGGNVAGLSDRRQDTNVRQDNGKLSAKQTMVNEQLESLINPGGQLGQYRIGGIVAQSRTAAVYRATDLRSGLDVAIKVPHPDVEKDKNLADWFRREREIGGRLDHPAIIRVIPDQGSSEDYLVMEWFEGKPLRQILNEEKRLAP